MFDIPEELQKLVVEVDKQIDPKLKEIDDQIVYNQAKVLDAFRKEEVAEADLTGVNGYGDDDMGRDKLDRVYARVFNTEAAGCTPSICIWHPYLVYCLKRQFELWGELNLFDWDAL